MWVRNKATGVSWLVKGELAERLAHSPEFEVIDPPEDTKKPESDNKKPKSTKKKTEGDK